MGEGAANTVAVEAAVWSGGGAGSVAELPKLVVVAAAAAAVGEAGGCKIAPGAADGLMGDTKAAAITGSEVEAGNGNVESDNEAKVEEKERKKI